MEAVVAEMRLLLGGFAAVLTGDAVAIKNLGHAPPNLALDGQVFLVLTVVIFALNWGLRFLVINPFIYLFLDRGKKKIQKAKFTQSCLECMMYGLFVIFGVYIVPSQEWVWPSANWWIGYADGGHEIMRTDLRCYYILYVARYSQGLVSLLLEPRRKDFLEMLIHHAVTVIVIYISYIYGWNRIGVVVMVLLDPADVPLHAAKLCKYMFDVTEKKMWQFLADRLFELFAVVFFVTRLILFAYVVWSSIWEAPKYFPIKLPERSCQLLLLTLLVLQSYWAFLIIKVAAKMWQVGGVEDVRSDDEDEDTPSSKQD